MLRWRRRRNQMGLRLDKRVGCSDRRSDIVRYANASQRGHAAPLVDFGLSLPIPPLKSVSIAPGATALAFTLG